MDAQLGDAGAKATVFQGDVELLPDLERLKFVRENLPESAVVDELERLRGRGWDDCLVSAMWRALVARVVLQHDTDASFFARVKSEPCAAVAVRF